MEQAFLPMPKKDIDSLGIGTAPLIRKPSHRYYGNKSLTARAWGAIAAGLRRSVPECKKMWQQLRFRYRQVQTRVVTANYDSHSLMSVERISSFEAGIRPDCLRGVQAYSICTCVFGRLG